jgi:hypothetical protein
MSKILDKVQELHEDLVEAQKFREQKIFKINIKNAKFSKVIVKPLKYKCRDLFKNPNSKIHNS